MQNAAPHTPTQPPLLAPAVVKARPPPAVVKAPPPRPPPAVAKRALVVEKQQQLADSERRLEKQLKQLPPAPAASSSDGSRYPPASMDESQRRAFTNIVRFMDAASAAEARDAITRRTSRGPVRDAAAWALASVERFRDEPDIKVVRMPKDVDAALVNSDGDDGDAATPAPQPSGAATTPNPTPSRDSSDGAAARRAVLGFAISALLLLW